MSNCRICQNSVPRYQTFCSHCGARQIASKRPAKKRGTFERLKDFFSKAFESEADRHYKAGCELMMFSGQEAVIEFEEALSLDSGNSLFKTALATAYWDWGTQQDMAGDYEGATESFSAATRVEPGNPHWYSALARGYKHKADLKRRGGLSPATFLFLSQEERAALSPKDAEQIPKLYEDACENYRLSLSFDPTDASSYMELAQILKQIGREREAIDNLQKALAILNKAIQVDNMDKQSYSDRAGIFEELGEIDLAIADLERELTFSTSQPDIKVTKLIIEGLRERKEETGKE